MSIQCQQQNPSQLNSNSQYLNRDCNHQMHHQAILELISSYDPSIDNEVRELIANKTDPSFYASKPISNPHLHSCLKIALKNIIKTCCQSHPEQAIGLLLETLFYGFHCGVIALSAILKFVDESFSLISQRGQRYVFTVLEKQLLKVRNFPKSDCLSISKIASMMMIKISQSESNEMKGRKRVSLSNILGLCKVTSGKETVPKTEILCWINKFEQIDEGKQSTLGQLGSDKKLNAQFNMLKKYFNDHSLILREEADNYYHSNLGNILKEHDSDSIDQNQKQKYLTKNIKTLVSSIDNIVSVFANNRARDLETTNNYLFCDVEEQVPKIEKQNQIDNPILRRIFLFQSVLLCDDFVSIAEENNLYLESQQEELLLDLAERLRNILNLTQQNINQIVNSKGQQEDQSENEDNNKSINQADIPISTDVADQLAYYQKCNTNSQFSYQIDMYGNIINPTSIDLFSKNRKLQTDCLKRLGLDGSKMKTYIKNLSRNVPSTPLNTNPSSVSFSYYYKESLGLIEELDEDESEWMQSEKNMYSMMEWKSLRALAKQSIRDFKDVSQEPDYQSEERTLTTVVRRMEEQLTSKRGLNQNKEKEELKESSTTEEQRQMNDRKMS